MMKFGPTRPLLVSILCSSLLLSCGSTTQQQQEASQSPAPLTINQGDTSSQLQIYVTNYPLKFMVEQIGGTLISATLPVPDDIDPAFWLPEPEAIAQMQTADLMFLNGATYEKWLPTVSLSSRNLVDTSAAFSDRFIPIQDVVTHSHGPEGEHSHSGTAFTTWIDFQLAAEQGRAIRDALVQQLPEHREQLEANFDKLERDLLELDRQLETAIANSTRKNQPLFASHPVYEYLARRYNLNLKSVLWEPEVIPNEVQWQELQRQLNIHPASWMIWESSPNPESVERLQTLGINSVIFAPSGNIPDEGSFIDIMKANTETLISIYRS